MTQYFQNRLLFTTDSGLEKIAADEFLLRMKELSLKPGQINTKPFGLWGHVVIDFAFPEYYLWPVINKMHAIHHVLRLKYQFELPKANQLDYIKDLLYSLDIPEFENKPKFRVSSTRSGRHDFQSPDIEREAGAVIVKKYRCPVDLENYDLHLRVNVFKDTCIVGFQLTNTPLTRRNNKPFQPRISLKTSMAYALFKLSDLEYRSTGRMLDPFCGSGTILVEAASINPNINYYGADIHQEKLDGALQNIQACGYEHIIELNRNDGRFIGQDYPAGFFDAIVCNPPYGFVMGKKFNFYNLYKNFLEGASIILKPGGKLVMLVMKKKLFEEILNKTENLQTVQTISVETGGIYPCIYVITKK